MAQNIFSWKEKNCCPKFVHKFYNFADENQLDV